MSVQDDDLLIARSLFLSMCREGSETLHRSECDRLAEWVWNHFHKGGTALKQQEVSQLVDRMIGSSYDSISLSRFLQWYCGIRQQIEDHRSNQDFGGKSAQDPLSIRSMGSIPYGRPSPEYSSQRSKAPTLLTSSGSGKSPSQQSIFSTKVEVNPPQEEVSLKAFLELKDQCNFITERLAREINEKNSAIMKHQKVEHELAQYRKDFKELSEKVQLHDQASSALQSKMADHRDDSMFLKQANLELSAKLAVAQEELQRARRGADRADEQAVLIARFEQGLRELNLRLEEEKALKDQALSTLRRLEAQEQGAMSVKERFDNQERAIIALQQSLQRANEMVREAHTQQQAREGGGRALQAKVDAMEAEARLHCGEAERLSAELARAAEEIARLQAQVATNKESAAKMVLGLNAGAVALAAAREEAERLRPDARDAPALRQALEAARGEAARSAAAEARSAAAEAEARETAAQLGKRLAVAETEATRLSGALAAANSIRSELDGAANLSACGVRALEAATKVVQALAAERSKLLGETEALRARVLALERAVEEERAKGAHAAAQILGQRERAAALEARAEEAERALQAARVEAEQNVAAKDALRRIQFLTVRRCGRARELQRRTGSDETEARPPHATGQSAGLCGQNVEEGAEEMAAWEWWGEVGMGMESQVCNADLLEKKAFLEARCGLAEARLADLMEEHQRGVAERDRSIAALERREAGGRLVVDAMLLDDIQVETGSRASRGTGIGH